MTSPPNRASLDQSLQAARAQFAKGQFFEAHETLEAAWMGAQGDLKTALQGLIQICAGLHKHARGEISGARYLIGRGLAKAQRCGLALPPGSAAPFERAGTRAFAELGEGS